MCLDNITTEKISNVVKICKNKCQIVKYKGLDWYVGWKVCSILNNFVELYIGNRRCNYTLTSNKQKVLCDYSSKNYMSGFHILLSKKSARRWNCYDVQNVYPVLFRLPRLIGKQYGFNVVIADKMIIFADIKKILELQNENKKRIRK